MSWTEYLGYTGELSERCRQLEEVAGEAVAMANRMTDTLSRRGISFDASPCHELAMAYLLLKSTNSLLAALSLCNVGLVESAKSVCRTLLEVLITTEYILLNRVELGQIYWAYFAFKRRRQLQAYLADPEVERSTDSEHLESIRESLDKHSKVHQKNLDELQGNKEFKKIKPEWKRGWAGCSIENMAKKCRLSKEYQQWYRMHSSSVHGDIMGLPSFADQKETRFDPYPDREYLQDVVHKSTTYHVGVMLGVDEVFGLNLRASLNQLRQMADEALMADN